MGLFSGLYIGRESLMSHGNAMASIANNIANVNTTGYKGERAEFMDLFAGGSGSLYGSSLASGNGSKIDSISMETSSGVIEDTGRDLDAAISGNGFFVVSDGTTQYYTRAGNFTLDADGYLRTQDGMYV